MDVFTVDEYVGVILAMEDGGMRREVKGLMLSGGGV